MRYLMLFTLFTSLYFNTYSQDTICTMISQNKVLEFQYNPSKIINKVYVDGSYYINVRKDEILVLHLYDKIEQNRKIVTSFPDNSKYSYTFSSKNDIYYSPLGPVIVEIKKPGFTN